MSVHYVEDKNMNIVCSECGKIFHPGNNEQGIPNGVGFVLEKGEIYNVCSECIEAIGREYLNGEAD